jgi:hypothetical protein
MVHSSHDTRFSDASTFDEICKNCGATDTAGSGTLHLPCTAKPASDEPVITVRLEYEEDPVTGDVRIVQK